MFKYVAYGVLLTFKIMTVQLFSLTFVLTKARKNEDLTLTANVRIAAFMQLFVGLSSHFGG